ncbi:MAG: phosphoribosylformylglycinamidine synthase subunit PurQ, partial [Spirochaetaceae bacterium]|nr:phosphoribosylformylglycinamidine synthase subunit PurQ [Spirochaetaceae bacterium]
VTSSRRLRMTWKGELVIDLDRRLLDTNGVRRRARALIPAGGTSGAGYSISEAADSDALTVKSLLKHLCSPAVASRRGLMERFDASVGGTTVLAPHGGVRQATPAEASVHLLPVDGDVETAGIMTVGFDPDLAEISPFRGGQAALIEALARMCAAGGSWRRTRFSLQEFFGRTDRGEESWGAPLAALLGALTVQRRWGLPAIGGKDSMSGSFEELDVPPTIIAFAAAWMDRRLAVGAALPGGNLTLALTPPFRFSADESQAPDFHGLETSWDWLESLNKRNSVKAAATVGAGGWASKLVMMALGNAVGFDLDETSGKRPFASDYGSIIIASDLSPDELRRDAESAGASVSILGRSIADSIIRWPGGELPLEEAEQAWRKTFADVWPEDNSEDHLETAKPLSTRSLRSPRPPGNALRSGNVGPSLGGGRPRVCIPVFPGTNGEDDARRAFLRAGAKPLEHILLDRDPHRLDDALSKMAADIRRSQILYVSGGFSAGDEPDGAGKYIAAILRHERIADAVRGLLDRDGLILGICNGFQALIKSGWLINGEAGVPGPDEPTLVRNRIGRHVARIVRTVASESSSPWMSLIRPKDVHSVPVSHGEGRFSASPELLARLEGEGRIPFRYCDMAGRPTMAGEFNPNGSAGAVEALLSPCGRILGKMGHSERWRKGTYIDVPGMETEQPLIKGGVSWFI